MSRRIVLFYNLVQHHGMLSFFSSEVLSAMLSSDSTSPLASPFFSSGILSDQGWGLSLLSMYLLFHILYHHICTVLLELAAIRASLCFPGLQVPPEQDPREEACPCPALAGTGWVILEFSQKIHVIFTLPCMLPLGLYQ